MKKRLLFITSMIAALSLTACGGGKPGDESKSSSVEESSESIPAEESIPTPVSEESEEESIPTEESVPAPVSEEESVPAEESKEEPVSEEGSESAEEESVPAEESSDDTPSGKKTLIYRSWDLGTEAQHNEERQLIEAFEEKENVAIKIVENPGSGNDYWTQIKASVYTGIDLADVMMVPNLDWPLAGKYLLDIKEYAANDPEFLGVPASIREACSFKSGIYAVPARMNLQGYFVNTTLVGGELGISTRNLNVNSDYSKIEDIVNAAKARDDIVGLDTATHFIDTMASVLDETGEMGYFTWDGSQYHLDSTAFTTGVQKAKEMFSSKKTLDAYDEEERSALGLDPEVSPKEDAWNKAKLAIRYGYTYEIPDMVANNTLNQSYKFIGNPGGKIAIVGDYYGIYAGTKEPELAYKFAKWMSFGMEGFQKRMDIYEPSGTINSLPLTNDEDLVEDYFDRFGSSSVMSGLEDAYEYIQENSMVEGVKVVPGFLSARQNKLTGISFGDFDNASMFDLLNYCVVGELNITDYTSGEKNIDTIADETYTKWLSTYGGQYE